MSSKKLLQQCIDNRCHSNSHSPPFMCYITCIKNESCWLISNQFALIRFYPRKCFSYFKPVWIFTKRHLTSFSLNSTNDWMSKSTLNRIFLACRRTSFLIERTKTKMCHKHDDFIKIPIPSGDFLHIPLWDECTVLIRRATFFADNSCIIALASHRSK